MYHVLPLHPARVTPGSWVLIRYIEDGWFPGKLSQDMKTVEIDREVYNFDPNEDEFVEYSSKASEFVALHPQSVLVKLADTEYIVSDPQMSVVDAVRALNALRHNSGLKLLPPLERRYESYSIADAATLCSPSILALHVT